MRILHTSDWHLGRSFHREGMLTHQAAYVDHLLEVVESERVDLVVVAGDVYDRALPQVDAVRLADEALARLAGSRAQVVLTSGNHDSAQRLGFSSRLIDAAGVFIRTDAATVGTPVELADDHGPVAVYGLPYLDPLALAEPWALPARSHEAALAEALGRVRRDLALRSPGTRSVVLAHAFVAGGEPSESERDISVGGVSRVPTGLFDGVDYVALGHLHGAQTLDERVRYSGSPLAYSFSEHAQTKGSWLVDLGAGGCRHGDLRRRPGPPAAGPSPGHPRRAARRPRPGGVRAVLGAGHPHRRRPAVPADGAAAPTVPARAGAGLRAGRAASRWPCRPAGPGVRSDHAIALDFVRELRGAPATEAESALLQDACDACCDDTDVDTLLSAAGGR